MHKLENICLQYGIMKYEKNNNLVLNSLKNVTIALTFTKRRKIVTCFK